MSRGSWIALVALVVTVLVVYSNALDGDFCYDENIVILRNDNVQDPARLWTLWTDTYWGTAVGDELDSRGYRPLTIFSYHMNHRISGNDPFAYHLTNVALHAACTALLLLLALRLRFGLTVAVPAAALFAVHAIHTEAVTQIVGRAELIAGLFMLLATLLHVEAFPHPDRPAPPASRRWMYVALAVLSVLLGFLGKESAIGFYGLVLATDLVVLGLQGSVLETAKRLVVSRYRAWLAYLLPLAAFLVLRWVLLGRAFPTHEVHFVDNPIVLLAPALRPLGALLVFGKVVLLLLVPAALSADYGYAQLAVDRFWTSPLFWFGVIALAALVYAAYRFRRSQPAATWGVIAFLLAWVPVSNALFPIQTVLGERVAYVPSMGFCLLMGGLFAHAIRTERQWARITAWSALALLLLFNAVRTPVRNRDWRSDLTLFDATAEVSTRSIRVLNNYGNVLYTRGDLDGAEKQYRQALSLYEGYDDARVNLAGVLIARRELEEARRHLEIVLENRPDHPTALSNMKLLESLE